MPADFNEIGRLPLSTDNVAIATHGFGQRSESPLQRQAADPFA